MQWDVFISHASEDKDVVARPLVRLLKKARLRVWFDEHELRLGDSLRGRIDEGLRESRYGVVILSKAFFSKSWSRVELDALAGRDTERKVILPIWHEVDHPQVAQYSPILASKIGVQTSRGVEFVALEIIRAVGEIGTHSEESRAVQPRRGEVQERDPLEAQRASLSRLQHLATTVRVNFVASGPILAPGESKQIPVEILCESIAGKVRKVPFKNVASFEVAPGDYSMSVFGDLKIGPYKPEGTSGRAMPVTMRYRARSQKWTGRLSAGTYLFRCVVGQSSSDAEFWTRALVSLVLPITNNIVTLVLAPPEYEPWPELQSKPLKT